MKKRIALLGNCQIGVLKDCLEPLTGAEVIAYPFTSPATVANVDEIAEGLASFDAVVSHQHPPPALAKLRPEVLSERLQLLTIPKITFTGYHPDFHLIPTNAIPKSPLGRYHSAIVLGCFLAGVSEQRAATLFNTYTYPVSATSLSSPRREPSFSGPQASWASIFQPACLDGRQPAPSCICPTTLNSACWPISLVSLRLSFICP